MAVAAALTGGLTVKWDPATWDAITPDPEFDKLLAECNDALLSDADLINEKILREGIDPKTGKPLTPPGGGDWSKYAMGNNTFDVSMEHFAVNRKRLVTILKDVVSKRYPSVDIGHSIVVLEGGVGQARYSSDTDEFMRQESYFQWAFGVVESGFYGAINLETEEAQLFMPRLPSSFAIWSGKIFSPEHFQKKYNVNTVHYVDEIADILAKQNPSHLLTLHGLNTDSGSVTKEATFDGIDRFNVNNEVLFYYISELRNRKTDFEMGVLRYANNCSAEAHRELMRHMRPDMIEYEMESLFHYFCYKLGGARFLAYTAICASGINGAVLHYGHENAPNDSKMTDGKSVVFDMGCEYYCYASDITCSYPINGKFSDKQRTILSILFDISNEILETIAKPDNFWYYTQLISYRHICENLKKLGLLQGEVDDMMSNNVPGLFMPHGLGHYMGLDVHDVNGYIPGIPRIPRLGYTSLRTLRQLKEGMVCSVEPGIYFIQAVLEPAFTDDKYSKFLVEDKIREWFDFGGMRWEIDIKITDTGYEDLSHRLPQNIPEIEALLAEDPKLWPDPATYPDFRH